MCSISDSPLGVNSAAELVASAHVSITHLAKLVTEEVTHGFSSDESAAELMREVELLSSLSDLANAVIATRLARIEASGAALNEGWSSSTRWLQTTCGRSEREARASLGRARVLRESFRPTQLAWLAGEASGDAVREIVAQVGRAARVLPHEQREAGIAMAQDIVLPVARVGTVADVNTVIDGLKLGIDPDGARQAEIDAYDDQFLTFTAVGAGVDVKGYLSHETAAMVQTVLGQIVNGWYRSGSLAPQDAGYEGETDAQRRRRQRLRRSHLSAVALENLAERALGGEFVGSHHGVAPHVTLTVDLNLMSNQLGAQLHVPGMESSTTVCTQSAQRMLCDAGVTAVVMDGTSEPADRSVDGRPNGSSAGASGGVSDGASDIAARLLSESRRVLWVGREHRTVPPRLRRALEVRDRHCAYPDCRVDVSRCHAHHVVEWEHGGLTDLDNCILLCQRHHRSVHEGGATIAAVGRDPRAAGYWSISPPRRRRW